MERSLQDINRAIHDVDFQCSKAFKKCKESAPIGYKFSTNLKNSEKEQINRYIKDGHIILPVAYNMFGDKLEGYVSVYTKL